VPTYDPGLLKKQPAADVSGLRVLHLWRKAEHHPHKACDGLWSIFWLRFPSLIARGGIINRRTCPIDHRQDSLDTSVSASAEDWMEKPANSREIWTSG